ncbi:MAG: type II toxin-antitoxin system Phd/YefM family antitoxin [Waterburya sp.]
MLNQWQLQEAKNKFSQVVKQAQQGKPQYITVHRKPTAIVVSIEDYQAIAQLAVGIAL